MPMALLKADFCCFDKKNVFMKSWEGFFTQKGRVSGRFDMKVRLVEGNKTRQKAESGVDRGRF